MGRIASRRPNCADNEPSARHVNDTRSAVYSYSDEDNSHESNVQKERNMNGAFIGHVRTSLRDERESLEERKEEKKIWFVGFRNGSTTIHCVPVFYPQRESAT